MTAPAIESPCVWNCCLDENDICLGCHRSLTEICGWQASSDAEKREILERCAARKREREERISRRP